MLLVGFLFVFLTISTWLAETEPNKNVKLSLARLASGTPSTWEYPCPPFEHRTQFVCNLLHSLQECQILKQETDLQKTKLHGFIWHSTRIGKLILRHLVEPDGGVQPSH